MCSVMRLISSSGKTEMKYIFFDIGANNGSSSIHIANNKNNIVYAFEPTPELAQILKTKTTNMQNYIITEAAVSDYSGTSILNIAGQSDWGCTSLLELSDKARTEWGGRTDMLVTHKVEVNVIRLDTFIEANGIEYIDYLHIDTQGSDLNVLKGLGKYINIVKEGVVEAANKDDVLYKQQNNKRETIQFLEDNNFTITKVELNDPQLNEVNIYFKKIVGQH